MIQIQDLIKIYKQGELEVQALRGISCSFNQGEIAVIMGPSGCGKTTLLNILGGISTFTAGRVIIETVGDIGKFSPKQRTEFRRKKIAYVFQNNNLVPNLTAWENVLFPYEILHKVDKGKLKDVNATLEFVGLLDRKDHFPNELSGGEQQRTCIAAALVKDVDIILCDEPTGELDSKSKQQLMKLFQQVITKYPTKVIIIVSHDPEFKLIADKFFYIRDGTISHELNQEELQEFRDGMATTQESPQKEDVLIELMEMKHFLTKKIKKIQDGKEN